MTGARLFRIVLKAFLQTADFTVQNYFDLTNFTIPKLNDIQYAHDCWSTIIGIVDREATITEAVNESGYIGLSRNCNQIINCAMLLSLGYIREATTYAESCGGGGSPGSGWGRDKDEDDEHWWRRCIAVSAAMMRPAKYRVRRGR